jgi:hypothetical protein
MTEPLIGGPGQAAREAVLADIRTEMESRLCHWGDERRKGWKAWLCFLVSEVGDVARQVSRAGSEREDSPALYRALVSIAAMVFTWLAALRWAGVSAGGIEPGARARLAMKAEMKQA